MDNEKKLYIKEQTVIDKKTKEIEAAKEIHKERETKEFEELGKIQTRIHSHIYIYIYIHIYHIVYFLKCKFLKEKYLAQGT